MSVSNARESGVEVSLRWLIERPSCIPSARLTCYREERGLADLFSIFIEFSAGQGGGS